MSNFQVPKRGEEYSIEEEKKQWAQQDRKLRVGIKEKF